jgi:hypothetical protein
MSKAVQELSSFYSEDGNKKAIIYRVLGEESKFSVSLMSETGSTFSAEFTNLADAEDFAEDWVL